MGDHNYSNQRTRSGIRDVAPYDDAELDAMRLPRDIIKAFDELGMAVIRMDTAHPQLSRLAEHWVGREVDTFLSSDPITSLRRTTHDSAQWDYACRSGRVVRIRRYDHKNRIYAFFHDVTIEADHRGIMADAAGLGLGFIHYAAPTHRVRLYGDFIDERLSPSEQLEARRTNLASLIHPRERERIGVIRQRLLENGESVDTVIECRCRQVPSFRLHVRLRAVRAEDGSISKILGSFRDVTAERAAQAELVRLRNEHSANSEARQFMVARIVHEVRTPLSGIVGMGDVLESRDVEPSLARQIRILVDAARDAMDMLSSLSERATDASTMDSLNPLPVDIHDLVTDATTLWTSQAQSKGVSLLCRIAPSMPRMVKLDSSRLRQCLTNLLSNAVKFTDSGRIEVILTPHPNAEDRFVLAVRDTGLGMTDAEQAKLFLPFVQANPTIAKTYGGTGLGLSITHSIVARMQGHLRCQSTPGQGTMFTIDIPMEKPETNAAAESDMTALISTILDKPQQAPSPLSQLDILAVDDNETNRLVVEQLLHGQVRSVTLAENGRDAMKLLETKPFDAVLMDIHMPIMDGIETTLAIRASHQPWSDIPIIALTADAQYQQKRVAVNLGMDTALAKPVTLDRLLAAFETLGLHKHAHDAAA